MTALADRIAQIFLEHLPPGRTLTDDANFFEAGFTSVRLAAVCGALAEIQRAVVLVDMYRYPTLRALTRELHRRDAESRVEETPVSLRLGTASPASQHRVPWETEP